MLLRTIRSMRATSTIGIAVVAAVAVDHPLPSPVVATPEKAEMKSAEEDPPVKGLCLWMTV